MQRCRSWLHSINARARFPRIIDVGVDFQLGGMPRTLHCVFKLYQLVEASGESALGSLSFALD